MISLINTKLDHFAQIHYKAIKRYFDEKGKKGNSLEEIQSWIDNTLGNSYTFENIIVAKPKELKAIKEQWLKFDQTKRDKFKFFKTLYDYLGDDKYKKTDNSPYNACSIGENLNIRVCPYCNENLAYNINKTFRRTYDLDHFYNKDFYPILAISFYNLIPSCKVCNFYKLNKDKDYIHPYDEAVDFTKLFHFSLDIKNYDFIRNINGYNIQLTYHSLCADEHKEAIDNSIGILHLDKRYQQHKDIILELLYKNQIYNSAYIDDLFNTYQGDLFKNREDLLRLLTGNYVNEDDLGKRPLAKLMKDISEALGLI